jgi:hypothetical protein
MSGRLVSSVFASALPAWLKPYAAAFASFAADDGSRVYPTVARVARMVGRSDRSTQRALHELRDLGVLVLEAGPGHHRAPRYGFCAAALPNVGDPDQLPLFPQAAAARSGANAAGAATFPHPPQVLTGRWCHPLGDMGVTRSVSDPSFSTHREIAKSRGRDKGKYPKTGT